ncbi:hypothetical protein [Streptomyces sp. NPDC046759]|uniref:hypothetical protein n=1 Tax=Streptomyces sp. NPDC046759 TaxID=3155019 RepID=UPI0033F7DAD8
MSSDTLARALLIGPLKGTSTVSLIAVDHPLFPAGLVCHRTCKVIPLLTVATVWCAVLTPLLGFGRHLVEKHHARGTGHSR